MSSSIISKNKSFVKESPKKLMTVLAVPFGLLLTVIIRIKAKKLMKVNDNEKEDFYFFTRYGNRRCRAGVVGIS